MDDSIKIKPAVKTSHLTTVYPDEVEAVLTELNLKDDSLDSPEFDVIAYINEIFPTEQSLTGIEDVIKETEKKIEELDNETSDIIRGRLQSEEDGQAVVQEAMELIKTLFARVHDVQDRATRSEQMVHDITKDIQQLDQAKRNLTISITTLNNLIWIVNALDRLNDILHIKPGVVDPVKNGSLTKVRRNVSQKTPFDDSYSNDSKSMNTTESASSPAAFSVPLCLEISNLLSQVQRLMQPMLSAYGNIPSIKGLSVELDTIHSVLSNRLISELKSALATSRGANDRAALIQAACELVDLLPTELCVKPDLLDWYIGRQLAEYKELFDPTQTAAWIDKVDHRYAWLRSNLPAMERRLQPLFPTQWHVAERLVVEFCRLTRIDLETVMRRRQAELTHNLIIFGLQRTLTFETSLNKVYSGVTLMESQKLAKCPADTPTTNPFDVDFEESTEDKDPQVPQSKQESITDSESSGKKLPFDGIVSRCFEAHFDLYLTHVDKALREQLNNRLIGDLTVNRSSLASRELSDVFQDDSGLAQGGHTPASDSGENTLYSATELFLLYKQVVKQTVQLNRGKGFLGLIRVLRRYLTAYTIGVLLAQVPGLSTSSSSGGIFTPEVTAKMASFGLSGLTAALGIGRSQSFTTADASKSQFKHGSNDVDSSAVSQLIQSLLRDDVHLPRLSSEDVHRVCVILVTSAFCTKTVEELEKRLKLEVRPQNWSSKISFTAEIDGFAACRSVCVHRLVSDLEAAAEPQLAAMVMLRWNSLTRVGDQSVYVSEIIKSLRSQIPLMRDTLYSVRATFTQICIKFAGTLITRFIASLYRCKPVNTFGAEQLLLDTQSLKSALLQLPVWGAKVTQPSPPRSFTNLVHEGMGRAEHIIKAVMLPVGSISTPLGSETTPSPPTGFVMGPVDRNAAEVFLMSYRQLLPDATVTDLQKVLDMKGVKISEQHLIVDTFRSYAEDEAKAESSNSKQSDSQSTQQTEPTVSSATMESVQTESAVKSIVHSASDHSMATNTAGSVRGVGSFSKLIKKRR